MDSFHKLQHIEFLIGMFPNQLLNTPIDTLSLQQHFSQSLGSNAGKIIYYHFLSILFTMYVTTTIAQITVNVKGKHLALRYSKMWILTFNLSYMG